MNWFASISVLPPAIFALAAAMTFGAAAIRGLTGFGMAILLVPLLGLIIRPDEAVVLAIFLQLLIGPVGLPKIIADSHKASALIIAVAAVAATPLGVWALMHTAPDVARLLIALIAIGAFLLLFVSRKAVHIPGLPASIATGLAAGVLTGFAAMPGPPVVPFYLRPAFQPATARASMMLVFFATAIAGTASATLLGLADLWIAWLAILLFVPMALGNWLGGLAFGKVSPLLWRGMVALLLGIAGASAVWRLFVI
jgi:uncharacterized protein